MNAAQAGGFARQRFPTSDTTFATIHFKPGSTVLSAKAKRQLRTIAAYFNEDTAARIAFVTSSDLCFKSKLELSWAQAMAVLDFLNWEGRLSRDRIVVAREATAPQGQVLLHFHSSDDMPMPPKIPHLRRD